MRYSIIFICIAFSLSVGCGGNTNAQPQSTSTPASVAVHASKPLFVYVIDRGGDIIKSKSSVRAYIMNAVSGALMPVAGSPFRAGKTSGSTAFARPR
jgi:hypothetical protein